MTQEMAPENVIVFDVFGMAASSETGAVPRVLVTTNNIFSNS